MSRLKEIRKSLGMTQTELAERLGLTQVTISGWERRKFIPKEHRECVAQILGVEVDALDTPEMELIDTLEKLQGQLVVQASELQKAIRRARTQAKDAA
jgi:transcriptional regulator with XRE-family HTH domain